MSKDKNKQEENKEKQKTSRCANSPTRIHQMQDSNRNTIPSCIYCGKIQ